MRNGRPRQSRRFGRSCACVRRARERTALAASRPVAAASPRRCAAPRARRRARGMVWSRAPAASRRWVTAAARPPCGSETQRAVRKPNRQQRTPPLSQPRRRVGSRGV
eukprot:5823914-Prymnesium_polylepis.1